MKSINTTSDPHINFEKIVEQTNWENVARFNKIIEECKEREPYLVCTGAVRRHQEEKFKQMGVPMPDDVSSWLDNLESHYKRLGYNFERWAK